MRIVSLFSGAGGLDLGLIQAGNEIIWANDIDKDAVATYRENIGGCIVCDDIKNIGIDDIPAADVVVGGFPCQGFSQANLKRSTDDDRNQLYKFFLKVVMNKQPLYFIAENVCGILSLDGGKAIEHIVNDFSSAGYNVTVNKVNMADYGVPQTRQRVIIIGQKIDLPNDHRFQFPKPDHDKDGKNGLQKWVTIKEAIGHFPDPNEENTVINHIYSAYKLAYRNFTGHRPTNPDRPSPTILARGNGKGGVCAIPHYNGKRRLTIRESASVQTFPESFHFKGTMNSCYRQIGNAVPVLFAKKLGEELMRLGDVDKK